MNLHKSPTYLTSLQLWLTLLQSNKGYTKSITLEQVAHRGWNKTDAGKETFSIRQELTIVERGILKSLSPKALKLVLSLMDELCMNNALWYFKAQSPHDRVALKELRDRNLLFKTEDASIHYVNPVQVRRGSVMSVVAQTTHILENMSRVHRDLITDLSYNHVQLSQLDQLNL
jgi:hypothetical protein